MDKRLERILPRVQKPARYTGGEYNQIIKDKEKVDLRVAFCFPDTYDIGMSHLGMKILYSLTNERENYWCERCFAPSEDFEAIMRENDIPLYEFFNTIASETERQNFIDTDFIPKNVSLEIKDFGNFYDKRKKLLKDKIRELLSF